MSLLYPLICPLHLSLDIATSTSTSPVAPEEPSPGSCIIHNAIALNSARAYNKPSASACAAPYCILSRDFKNVI